MVARDLPWTLTKRWRHISIGSRRIPCVDVTISGSAKKKKKKNRAAASWATSTLPVFPVARWPALLSDFAGSHASHTCAHKEWVEQKGRFCLPTPHRPESGRGERSAENKTRRRSPRTPRVFWSPSTTTSPHGSRPVLSRLNPFPQIDGNERRPVRSLGIGATAEEDFFSSFNTSSAHC